MHAEAQVEVEHQRAVFDQQVFVAGAAVDDGDGVVGFGGAVQDGFGERGRSATWPGLSRVASSPGVGGRLWIR
jgi:hypothetical protein